MREKEWTHLYLLKPPEGKITCSLGVLYLKDQLIKSLSFVHPMKLIKADEKSIDIKLFDVSNDEELNEKLDVLAEASSIDFSYKYAFVE